MFACHRLGQYAALGCVSAAVSTTALADNPAATIHVYANFESPRGHLSLDASKPVS
jgi:hypothetical protein